MRQLAHSLPHWPRSTTSSPCTMCQKVILRYEAQAKQARTPRPLRTPPVRTGGQFNLRPPVLSDVSSGYGGHERRSRLIGKQLPRASGADST